MSHSLKPPKPAATILLVKEAADGTPCFFLVKRHGRSGFMAGAHVFPGGRVDPDDASFKVAGTSNLTTAWSSGIPEDTPPSAFVVAAIRETAEECGVFLAADQSGNTLGPDAATHLFSKLKEKTSFHTLVKQHHLDLRLQDCIPYSWWVTPEKEPKRYDTRFFIARIPEGQVASFDAHEVVGGDWFSAKEALAAYASGSILLAPPTFAILEDLSKLASFDSIVAHISFPLEPICPVLTKDDTSDIVLALPGDRLHPSAGTPQTKARTRLVYTEAGRFASAFAPS